MTQKISDIYQGMLKWDGQILECKTSNHSTYIEMEAWGTSLKTKRWVYIFMLEDRDEG